MKIETDESGGRVFFSTTGRSLEGEDEICVLSVGVDIGSSTSHLVFSRIVLERLDSRYVVTQRETFYQSDILLTPYASEDEIDAEALGAFFEKQYENAMVDPDEIDAGALILTGVAVRRSNARRIGELVRAPGWQACRGERRRQSRDGDGGLWLRCGGALDPRQRRGDECRRRRRHRQDRGVRRGPRARDHRGRCRRAPRLHRCGGTGSPGSKKPAAGSARISGSRSRSAARSRPTDAQRLAARMADSLFDAMRGGAPKLGATGLLAPRSPRP